MARDTKIAWQLCDESEDSADLDLSHATHVFEAWKKDMRANNMKSEVVDDPESEPRAPKRGEHRTKVTLTDSKGKRLNEFRHKCFCESPY